MAESDELVFKGVDGTECEIFIRTVKIQARKQNKLRDETWILDLVQVSLAEKALRWFIKLDPAIRSSWDLLQEALIDRFPSSEPEEGSSTIPTPAAAIGTPPTLNIESELSQLSLQGGTLSGRIRIVSEGPSVGRYVSVSLSEGSKPLTVTNDPTQALLIEFTPSHGPFSIRILNSPIGYSWLAVVNRWHIDGYQMRFGSIRASSHPASRPLQAYQEEEFTFQSTVWTLMFDNTLVPTWEEDGKTYHLVPAINTGLGQVLTARDLSKTIAAVSETSGFSYCGARLVFEPGV